MFQYTVSNKPNNKELDTMITTVPVIIIIILNKFIMALLKYFTNDYGCTININVYFVVVPFVLCFGVEILCCLNLMYVFKFLLKFRVTEWLPIGKYLIFQNQINVHVNIVFLILNKNPLRPHHRLICFENMSMHSGLDQNKTEPEDRLSILNAIS